MRFTKHIKDAELVDDQGKKIGSIKDLVINLNTKFPQTTHVVAQLDETDTIGDITLVEPVKDVKILIPLEQLGSFKDYKDEKKIKLKVDTSKVQTRNIKENELLIGEHILDQQIINNEGIGLRRVSDVVLLEEDDKIILVGLSVGLPGVIEQLGFEWPVNMLNKLIFLEEIKKDIIPWNYVSEFKPKKRQIQLGSKDSNDTVVKVVHCDYDEDEVEKIMHQKRKI